MGPTVPFVRPSPARAAAAALAVLAVAIFTGVTAPPAAATAKPDTALECLALAVYWEARSSPPLGRDAVAAVVLNRVRDPAFPDTVCGVVREGGEVRGKCQFSWWCDGRSDRPANRKVWNEAVAVARRALDGAIDDPTGGALFFHHESVNPGWAAVRQRTVQIGRHIFYR